MKAITCVKYGPADLLELKDVPRPTPKANEVLVEVVSSSINAYDWHFYTGTPWLARFAFGLLKPSQPVPGADMAGIVEQVGKAVTQFKPGDRVVGEAKSGTWAEYACTKPNNLTLLPEAIPFEDAAALPMAAQTALQGLRDHALVKPGQKVLINGSTGGVGTFSVQIAKILGAEVWAVCRTGNIALVKSLGADHIIDYKKEDFRNMEIRWDVVMDNVGNITRDQYEPLLELDGTGLMVGFQNIKTMMGIMLRQRKKAGTGKPRVFSFTAAPNGKDMEQIIQWMEAGKLRSHISHRFFLDEAPKAAAMVEDGHIQGKVVININQN